MSLAEWFDAVRGCAVEMILNRARGLSRVRGRGGSRTLAAARRSPARRALLAEFLEGRVMLSTTPAVDPIATPPITIAGPISFSNNNPNVNTPGATAPFTPANIVGAYGVSSITFNGVSGTGAGQTIAIIDAYNDPNIVSDASLFNTHFGLPQFNTTGNATFQVLNQNGQSSSLPSNVSGATGDWDTEEALDVEWAHSIAPKANIILFEANSASDSDLYTAVQTAADTSGVSVVSMSFGSSEFNGEQTYDSTFTTPNGHQGVTFLASTGDSNAPAEYPAYSPNVVAVGGTSLTINVNGSYGGESAWGNVAGGSGGGGGVSVYETQPSFQTGNVNGLGGSSSPKRTAPDISMLADPNTGVYIYSSWAEGANNGGYYIAGGTSLAAPIWAGLISIVNQDRVLNSLTTLDGRSQTLPRLYQLPSSDFHDITTGNNGFAAGTGYDLATGIGSPIANLLVPALSGVSNTASKLVFSVAPSNATAGASISPAITVDVEDAFGDVMTSDTSSVTLAFTSNAGGATLSGTTTVAAVNGVATFTGLSVNKNATYTLTATDGSLTSATSGNFTISVGAASQVVFTRQPSNTTIGVADSPPLTVSVEDPSGNIITNNTSTITLTLSSGAFSSGNNTASVSAVAGVATFSNLVINNAATYTLAASDGVLNGATSSSFTVAKATPIVSVSDGGGTYNGSVFAATSASAVDPVSSATIASFGNFALSYAYYAGTLTTGAQVLAATALGGAPSTAGAYTVVATYAGSANYNSASGSPVNFSIAQRVLHVTATGQNKIYDGTNTAAITFSDDRVAGDSFTISDTSAIFSSKNVGTAITITVAGLSITGGVSSNYTLSSTSATTSANITTLAITGTITANSKVYDHTTAATLASEMLSGVIGGDSVSLTGGTATFNSKDVASATTVTAAGLALTGAQAANYTLSNPTETAAVTITPLAIAGTVTASGKVYDGGTAATIASRSLAGVLGADVVSMTGGTGTFNSKDVLVATTVTVTGLALTGAQAGDYSLSNPTETASASITPLSITATIYAGNKTYDGTTAATLTSQTLADVISGDTVSITGGGATFNTKDAANFKIVTLSGAALSGAQSADYSLANPNPTTTANVTPLAISGTIVAANKTYDATTHATISSQTLTGVLGVDQVTLTGGTASFDTKDVGNSTTVTDSGLTLAGTQAADYTLSNPTETTTANVTPLSISGSIVAAGKTYDGTFSATISSKALAGVLGTDSVTLTGGTATFNSKDVGAATTVTDAGLSLAGAQAGDYSLSNPTETGAAGISPLSITLTITADDKTYDGGTAATLSSETLPGVMSGDSVSVSGGAATFASKDAGNGKTVTLNGVTLNGAQAADYVLANPAPTTTANVTPLAITGSIVAANKIYDGTTHVSLTSLTLTGLIGVDVVTLASGSASFDTVTVGNAKTVTDSGMSLAGTQAGDYGLSNPTETTTANITQLSITGNIAAASKTYDGGTSATLTSRTLTGVIGLDDVSLIGGTAAFASKDAGNGKTVTLVGVALSGAQAVDYSLADPTPTTTANVTRLGITGAIAVAGKIYDGTNHATITSLMLTGVIGSDQVTLTNGTATFDTKDAGNGKTVTDSGMTLGGAQAGDYTLNNPTETATANVTPLSVTGSVTIAARIYDGTTNATLGGGQLAGVLGSDGVSLSGGAATFNSADVSSATTVTIDGLTLTGTQAGDYTLSNPSEIVSAGISPLPLTLTIVAGSKTYDGSAAAALSSEVLNGVIGSDDVTFTGGNAAFATKDAGDGKTVTLNGVTLVGAQAADYVLSDPAPTTIANIAPLAITGSITAANKTYDGTNHAAISGSALVGVMGADAVTLAGGVATFDTKDVGNNKTVTDLGLTLAGANAGDYVLANPNETTTANISPLSISATVTVASKIYDGTPDATITGQTLNGALGGDDVALSNGTATFNTKDTSATTATITGLALIGAAANDYVLVNPTQIVPGEITARDVAGSITANSKVFDGTTAATLAAMNLTGVLGADAVNLSGGAANFDTSAMGSNKLVTATGLTLSGAQAGDYSLVNPTETASAEITPLTVSGSIINDTNADGNVQAGEAGLAGRTVTLQIAGKGTKGQRTLKTDANGNFSFAGLSAGNYVIRVTTPAGWHATTAATLSLSVHPGANINSLFFCETNTTSVSGSVFLDANANRKHDKNEGGLAGWTVVITSVGSSPHQFTTVTDATGAYVFPAVPAGAYHVSVVQQSGFTSTTRAPHYFAVNLTPAKAVTGELFGEQVTASSKSRLRKPAARIH